MDFHENAEKVPRMASLKKVNDLDRSKERSIYDLINIEISKSKKAKEKKSLEFIFVKSSLFMVTVFTPTSKGRDT